MKSPPFILAAILLPASVIFAGRVAAGRTPAERRLPSQTNTTDGKRQQSQPRRDLFGESLPDGVLARMGTQRLRHPMAVRIAFSTDGQTLISAGLDQTVRFWDRTTGRLKRTLPVAPTTAVVALSPDGKTLVLLGKEEFILWDIATSKETRRIRTDKFTFELHSDTMVFSPDAKMLAATSFRNGTFCIWDAVSGKERGRYKLEGISNLAFSSDGKMLAVGRGKRLVLWDVAAGKELRAITGSKDYNRSLTFSPDGKLLGVKGDSTFMLWETASGKEAAVLQVGSPCPLQYGDRGSAFSPDGKVIAIPHDDYVALWDWSKRKEQKRLHGPRFGFPDQYAHLCFSADGKHLALLRTNAIVLWDVATGKQVSEQPGHFAATDSLAFSPDGKLLASAAGADRTVRLWDARSGEQLHVWPMPHSKINKLMFTSDGTNVIAEGNWGDCRIWDVRSGEQRHIFRFPSNISDGRESITATCLSPDGKRLTASSLAGKTEGGVRKIQRFLTTWDVANGERIERRAMAFDSKALSMSESISPDGKWITALQAVGRPRGAMIYDVAADRPLRNLPVYGPVLFSPDSKMLAYDGIRKPIQLMAVPSGESLLSIAIDGEYQWAWAFTPDCRYLLAVYEKDLRMWELATGREVMHRRLTQVDLSSPFAHYWTFTHLAIAEDGRSAAMGLPDTSVLVWDLAPATRQRIKLHDDDLDRLWNELAGDDAPRAYRAAGTLIADPQRTVPFLRERLRPVKEDAPRIRRLIADLDSEKFTVRDAAYKELEKMDDAAHAVLRQALPKAASLELRRRIESLLSVPWVVRTPEKLRQIRAIMVLEQIGDAAARHLLERLAGGAADARQTREAIAALQRLRNSRIPG